MKYIEKTIKIILSIVLVMLFIPFFLYSSFDILRLVVNIVFFGTLLYIYIYAIWTNLFENEKRGIKFFFYFIFLIMNFVIFFIAFFTDFGIRDDIHEGNMQEGLISSIINVWLPYFTFFSNFCFFLIILMFINNLVFNNRPLKWRSWLIVAAISLVCAVVCSIFCENILYYIIFFPSVISYMLHK